MNGTYDEIDLVQFLRTTYKAGPLVAVSLAWLAGTAAAAAWPRLRGRVLRLAAVGAAAGLLVLSSWPLATGRGIDELVAWDRIPGPWEDAASDLDDELPPATRGVVLPGQLYAFYDWGATIDPVLPALTDRPVAVANVPPYSDLRAVDLLWTVDALVRQRRLVPGQLQPLLELMGAASVVTGTDDDANRSGAPEPAAAAAELAEQGLGDPVRSYGAPTWFAPPAEDATAAALLPQVRRYDLAGARQIVRVESIAGATVVDGSADGVANAAAFGRLPRAAPILYAADRTDAELQDAAASGASFVVTDTNRKRVLVPSRPRQNVGATLTASEDFPENATVLDPFPDSGDEAQTLAVLDGARSVSAPFAPGYPQFPEHRPYAAVDGNPDTYWLADSHVQRRRHRLEVRLDEPRDIPYVDLLPERTGLTDVTAVSINGRRFDIKPGGNRLPVDLDETDSLTVRIAAVRRPEGYARGPGAIAELRIPGVRIREHLRPPTRIEDALRAGGVADVPLTYLFSRTSGDDPFRRSPGVPPAWRGAGLEDTPVEFGLVARPGDGERRLARTIDPPSARGYRVRAWLALAPGAPDPALDRLVGTAGRARFKSSGRLHGLARYRASRAFDGDPATAWAMNFDPGTDHPTLSWRHGPHTPVRTLRLKKAPGLPLPTTVGVSAVRGRFFGPLSVGADGTVRLPRAVSARAMSIIAAAIPPDASVVGIGEVRGAGVPRAPAEGARRVRAHCGDAWVDSAGGRLPLRPRGAVAALENGQPLRATSCGGALGLPAGRQNLSTGGGLFAVEHLMLESPGNGQRATGNAGRVLDLGDAGRSSRDGVRVALNEPAWLVLGEAYNRGWRAWCDDRSLGEPEPIDGYANGWQAPADCRDVRFAFAPQRFVIAGYIGSGALLVIAVLLLLLTRPRAPKWHVGAELARLPSTRRFAPVAAVLIALAAAAVVAGLFGLRAGAVAAPVLALLLWRGAGVPLLFAAAGFLLGRGRPAALPRVPGREPQRVQPRVLRRERRGALGRGGGVGAARRCAVADPQYGQSPRRRRRTVRTLITTLRANQGSWAHCRIAFRTRAVPLTGARVYSASEPVLPS